MITVKLSAKDTQTVARIIAEKAVEMNKKGAMWMRGDEELSCLDMGKISNKFQSKLGSEYDFKTFFSNKSKPTKKV